MLLHGAWHVGTYDGLYLRGEVMSVIMVLVAYVALPMSVAFAPVVMASLPVDARRGGHRHEGICGLRALGRQPVCR